MQSPAISYAFYMAGNRWYRYPRQAPGLFPRLLHPNDMKHVPKIANTKSKTVLFLPIVFIIHLLSKKFFYSHSRFSRELKPIFQQQKSTVKNNFIRCVSFSMPAAIYCTLPFPRGCGRGILHFL